MCSTTCKHPCLNSIGSAQQFARSLTERESEQTNPLVLRRGILVLLLAPVLGKIPVLLSLLVRIVRIVEPLGVVLKQVAPAHPAALSRRGLRVLHLAQRVRLGFLLVHPRLFPFGKRLARDGRQVRAEFVSLRVGVMDTADEWL